MAKGGRARAVVRDPQNTGGAAALGAGAGVALLSNTSTPTLTNCSSEDKSFNCKLTRFFNNTKMIITLIIMLLALILTAYYGYKWFASTR